MKKYEIVALLALTACGGGGGPGGGPSESPKIYTSGHAEKRVEPNMALVTFAVQTRGATAEKARADNAVKSTALVAKLKELKIPEDDLQTLDFRIGEILNYQNGSSKVEAYEVVSRMQLRMLDVKSVGKVIDQLVPLGANKIENVEFDVAEKEEIYRVLLEEATSLAKEKANRISEAAGLGKVSVLEAREEVNYSPGPMYKFSMAASARGAEDASTQMAPSAVLKANVSLTAKAKD